MVDFFFQYGLAGLFLAGFLSGSVFPFNSEAVLALLIYAGFDITKSIAVATAGNTLGGISIYYLGYLGRMEWIEKYAKVKEEKIEKMLPHLRRYGPITAFLSFLPLVGDVFVLALGFFRISPILTTIYMLVGKIFRYIIFVCLLKAIF